MSETRVGSSTSKNMFAQLGGLEPWASLAGGAALAIYGLSKRSWPGLMMAAAGGLLVYRGITNERSFRPVHVESSYTIMKPVGEVWAFWRNLENFPRFMSHLESVVETGNRWSHWVARGPMGTNLSWRAQITSEQENQYLVWETADDSPVQHRGSVQFRDLEGDRGTQINVAIDYVPPAGRVGDVIAMALGHAPEQKIREDLRHMKQLLETGEIPTTEGQPSGKRSAISAVAQMWGRERRREGVELIEKAV